MELKTIQIKAWFSPKLMKFLSMTEQMFALTHRNTTEKHKFAIGKPKVHIDETPVIFKPFIRDPKWFKANNQHLIEIPNGYWSKYTLNEALKLLCIGLQATFFVTDFTEEWELKIITIQPKTI